MPAITAETVKANSLTFSARQPRKRVRLSASRTAISSLPYFERDDRPGDEDAERQHQRAGRRTAPARVVVGLHVEAENVLEIGQAVIAAEAHVVAEEGEQQRIGQRLGDDRQIDAGDAERKANQPKTKASRPGTSITISAANQKWSKPYQNQGSSFQFRNTMKSGRIGIAVDAARADLAHQIHAHRIAAEREEGAVAEREDAAIAPDQIERQRQQRVAEIFADQRHDIGRHVQRAVGRQRQRLSTGTRIATASSMRDRDRRCGGRAPAAKKRPVIMLPPPCP